MISNRLFLGVLPLALLACRTTSAESTGRPSGSEATLQSVSSVVEGVYMLKEWHTGQEVLQPPAIDGRFVLSDGVVVTVLKNWSQPTSRVSAATYGSYKLDGSDFSYKYEEGTVVTESASEAKVSHKLIFDGARSFTVSREQDGVRFRRAEGKIEFAFTKDGLVYSENGKVLRVWQRVNSARPS